jgi:N-acetylglucosamine kinase-like BadF-type ATPase
MSQRAAEEHRELLLGIDGGGTSTVALVADAETGEILGRGVSGTSNPKSVGWPEANRAIQTAAAIAFESVPSPEPQIRFACYGISGCDRPEDRHAFERHVTLATTNSIVVNDGEIVLAAGTPDGHGIAVVSGTGSIAVGRDIHGRTARAGGWGPIFGDEGSAYGVAVAALRAVARGNDLRARSRDRVLENALFDALQIENARALVSVVYSATRPEIAALALTVEKAFRLGSPTARALFHDAARELAMAVRAVATALNFSIECRTTIAFAGGFLTGSQPLREALVDALPEAWRTQITDVVEPAQGALVLARRKFEASHDNSS